MFRKRQGNAHSPALFLARKNDFFNHRKKDHPLKIDRDMFIRPANEIIISGGSATYGPYFVKRKPESQEKLYYVSKHTVDDEYFALEILQYLGINTPKLRVTSGDFKDSPYSPTAKVKLSQGIAAVKSMDNYLPMFYLLSGRRTNDVILHLKRQVVVDLKNTARTYKISGQVFASYIAACLIDDSDFGFEDFNLGLFRVGNRYYSAAIDKDCAQFRDSVIHRIRYSKLKLFQSTCRDQELFILSRIEAGLKTDAHGVCDFDRIFINSRTQATPEIIKDSQKKCLILKARAQNIINLYLHDDPTCMQEFHRRESIRREITSRVLNMFEIEDSDRDAITNLIMEDLRGPYYTNHHYESDLVKAITNDISKEFPELAQRSHRKTNQR